MEVIHNFHYGLIPNTIRYAVQLLMIIPGFWLQPFEPLRLRLRLRRRLALPLAEWPAAVL